jgi:hypothetical protein
MKYTLYICGNLNRANTVHYHFIVKYMCTILPYINVHYHFNISGLFQCDMEITSQNRF